MEKVILVDIEDNTVGTMEKMEAHKKGILHRAFSIVLFNSQGEMLLQKRARTKYHSGGLWTNACCSHPQPNELLETATQRKLKQEMGIEMPLEFLYKFIYEAPLANNLIEHELDHVFTGTFDGTPVINPDEVEDWKFVNMESLRTDIHQHPERYTTWFRLIVEHPEINSLMTSREK